VGYDGNGGDMGVVEGELIGGGWKGVIIYVDIFVE
jgi:hypothetical protein